MTLCNEKLLCLPFPDGGCGLGCWSGEGLWGSGAKGWGGGGAMLQMTGLLKHQSQL